MKFCSRSRRVLSLTDPLQLAQEICQNRKIEWKRFENARFLQELTPPHDMLGLKKACERLERALSNREKIGIISDHDCDGQTACAVILETLYQVFDYPNELIQVYIGHRLKEGYGISAGLFERIVSSESLPQVIITADCGSSDHDSILKLSSHGIDVIVTDHHHIPSSGVPSAAYAVLNPRQDQCGFPDQFIAGCAVAWFFMAALRSYCSEKWKTPLKSVANLIDFVGIGTLADCVSLTESSNNRIILRQALKSIRQLSRPCWRVLKQVYDQKMDCDFLIFKVIPLINASGRLSDGLGGVHFLLSEDMVTAQERLAELISVNDTRKQLQREQSLKVAEQWTENMAIEPAIVLSLAERGHLGIHGVTAGQLCEEHKKLTILFSALPHDPSLLSGSARAPFGWSIKKIFENIAQTDPTLMKRFGGHDQAGGVLIHHDSFEQFRRAVLREASDFAKNIESTPLDEFYFDGLIELQNGDSAFQCLQQMEEELEPFGKDFPKPVFGIKARATEGRLVGADKNHLQWVLEINGQSLKACLFFCKDAPLLLKNYLHEDCIWIGDFSFEKYRGVQQCTLMIKHVIRIHDHVWSSAKGELEKATYDFSMKRKTPSFEREGALSV